MAPDLRLVVHDALRATLRPGETLALALSGGIDSMVLLELLCALRETLPLQLSALHVNHGISPHAARWAEFCRAQCARRGVPLTVREVTVTERRHQGLEAAAREARYRALAELEADAVALAHTLDDQAETVLLQLLRGAGLPGLAAMPAAARGRPRLLRPLLTVPRSAVAAYAAAQGVEWVEDESNADTALDRNYLRHDVLPLLEDRFPGYRKALARAGRHLGEAAALLAELAHADGATLVSGQGIAVAGLARLTPARARNLLRHFITGQGAEAPPAARLEEMLRQLLGAGRDSRVRVCWGRWELRRWRGHGRLIRAVPPRAAWSVQWDGGAVLDLGQAGRLNFAEATGGGLSRARLDEGRVTLRSRRGGERLQPRSGGRSRSLKNLLQESAVPPWDREWLPLVWVDDELACVPGVAVDVRYQAAPGEAGLVPTWRSPWAVA